MPARSVLDSGERVARSPPRPTPSTWSISSNGEPQRLNISGHAIAGAPLHRGVGSPASASVPGGSSSWQANAILTIQMPGVLENVGSSLNVSVKAWLGVETCGPCPGSRNTVPDRARSRMWPLGWCSS